MLTLSILQTLQRRKNRELNFKFSSAITNLWRPRHKLACEKQSIEIAFRTALHLLPGIGIECLDLCLFRAQSLFLHLYDGL